MKNFEFSRRKHLRKNFGQMIGGGLLVLALTIVLSPASVSAKTFSASLQKDKIPVGATTKISCNLDDVTFKSSNREIATVSDSGVITGKKSGSVQITATTSGGSKKSFPLTIVTRKYKPTVVGTTFDDLKFVGRKMTLVSENKYDFSFRIKNTSKTGTIKKIVLHYSYKLKAADGSDVDKTKIVVLKNIKPQEVSDLKTIKGDYSGDINNMNLYKVDLYSKSACLKYNFSQNSVKLYWGTKDTTAPTITGYLEGDSKDGNGDYYRVYYSDRKNSYDFKDFIKVSDDRDANVKLKINTDKINWKKNGIYKIYYKATDSSGNVTKTWVKARIIVTGAPEKAADEILSSIIKTSWSDKKKAIAIFDFVKDNISYSGWSKKDDWRYAGHRTLNNLSGDCYGYYSISRLLLVRAGIPCVEIERYPIPGGQDHHWNLVYVKGGWYHFDTTPRRRDARFCLLTDSQMNHYSTGYTFRFNKNLYPARATKQICKTPKPISQCH
ncbi:MAG: transglutaminase domain-containing protein [Agathobacter sp.]|nr:transglutaminase domain-containing protein [Agathobacter sp.]